MAKEMIIIFVYDTQLVKKEEDDPASAILYFHPNWVSDQQKTALCGQIMGTVHCLKALFNCPKIVSLQSGKFIIKEYGRYVLAVGTDRNVADWVLEHRTDTLSNLIQFFHHDLELMACLYQNNSNFSAKLYHMFETYLKILTYGGSVFSNVPEIQLPKNASSVFLEATHVLQCFQEVSNVLGGTMLYHNKVVATQLDSHLTKLLLLTDPYRIKSPAEIALANFQLPLGVQLLQVYIEHKHYSSLHKEALQSRTVFQYLSNKSIKKMYTKAAPSKEIVMATIKRDQSLLFTSVPEEDSEYQSPTENVIVNVKTQNRPKFLNLRNKTTDTKCEEKSNAVCTPFSRQTSVCSTPITELKRVLHQSVMSICTNPAENFADNKDTKFTESYKTDSVKSLLSAFSEKCNNSNKELSYLNIEKNLYDEKKSLSMQNIKDDVRNFNQNVTLRYYGIGLPAISHKMELENVSSAEEENMKSYKTIADPTFPVFRSDGKMISRNLYWKFMSKHLNIINSELKNSFQHSKKSCTEEWQSLDDFDSKMDFSSDANNVVLKKSPEKTQESKNENTTKMSKKKLSLPLKSLSTSSSNRRYSTGGVQLTPLMSKLSLLAGEERSSGFCSRDTTPSEYKDFIFTPTQPNYTFQKVASEKEKKDVETDLQKCVLFVCGQQDMVVAVLLEEDACKTPDTINRLWEISTESLGKLENRLRHCLEMYPNSTGHNENDPYSYLCLDSEWNTVRRGGPWNGTELGILTHLHRDFINTSNLTEIILRDEDNIVYGHHCGSTEVFYHQSVSGNAGLPTPADSMGTIPLKAKRRLERDHAIILL